MADLRTLEDFVRHRLGVDRRLRLHVFTTGDGRFQASLENTRSKGWSVEIHEDPITAIWNVLVPFTMRRGPMTLHPEGLDEAKAAGDALDEVLGAKIPIPRTETIDLEEVIAAASDPMLDVLG